VPTRDDFLRDSQGRRFADVVADGRVSFDTVLAFFDAPERRQQMESATRDGRPALAAVVGELEALPEVDAFFRDHDASDTTRFRQAVGVVVRIVMVQLGWERSGQKGYLGTRTKANGTSTRGAAYNVSGPSRWFNRAELYLPPRADIRDGEPDSGLPRSCLDASGRLRISTEADVRRRSGRIREGFARLESIGTESERRDTLDFVMKALSETRAAEGRPF
jgi:hypothetical protein